MKIKYPLFSRGLYRCHYAKHIDDDALAMSDEGSEGT